MPLSDEQWSTLAGELRRALVRADPAWSDAGGHDPGVAMLALFAFALDELAYRGGTLSDDARARARDVGRRAGALATTATTAAGDGPCGAGLVRPRFFAGQLLSAEDLRVEQDYLLDRLARRNRLLSGAGIVDGLDVTVAQDSDRPHVVIAPGLAFDPWGREIAVDRCRRLPLPQSASVLVVQLGYRELPCNDVPAPATANANAMAATSASAQPTRIVETFAATLAALADEGCVAIARVRHGRGGWRVDRGFRPARVRR